MLAVGTSDGRVRLIGRTGVESTLVSKSKLSTVSLRFLKNRGSLLRLDEEGTLELWNLEDLSLTGSLTAPRGDTFTCFGVVDSDSLIILGCAGGGLRTACLLDAAGLPSPEAKSVHHMTLSPAAVSPLDLQAGDQVVEAVEPRRLDNGSSRVLVLHCGVSVTVWDLKSRAVVARHTKEDIMSVPQLRQAWAITCACWASADGDAFMTGHESGIICNWRFSSDGAVSFGGMFEVCNARDRDPVHGLSYVMGDEPSLLVLGGHMSDLPQSLSLISMPHPGLPEEPHIHSLPWFGALQGYALVKPHGSFADDDIPTAVIAITEGGHLCIHDLKKEAQNPFSLDFQAVPVCVSTMVAVPSRPAANHALCIADLRSLAHPRISQASGVDWCWVLSCGVPADNGARASDSDTSVLVTGHPDGSVALWDVASEVPTHLHSLKDAAHRAVTSLALDCAAGVLAVGHEWGQVDVYQWCMTERSVLVACLGDPHSREKTAMQPAGWQRVMVVSAIGREDATTCLAWHVSSSGKAWLAAGQRNGSMRVVDCNPLRGQPRIAWTMDFGMGALGCAHFCYLPGEAGAPVLALLIVAANSAMRAFDAASGEPIGHNWMAPKNVDDLCMAVPLTAHGTPVSFEPQIAQFQWAGNLVETPHQSLLSPTRSAGQVGLGKADASSLGLRSNESPPGHSFRESSPSMMHSEYGDEEEDEADMLAAAAAEEKARKAKHPGKVMKGLFAKSRSRREGSNDHGRPDGNAKLHASGSSEVSSPKGDALCEGHDNLAMVAFVLVVTKHYIRLYPRAALLTADRTCTRKEKKDTAQIFAGTFLLPNGPGLMVLEDKMGLAVYALPGFKPLAHSTLEQVAGFKWDWELDAAALKNAAGRCALCPATGKLLIAGPSQELLILGVDPLAGPLNAATGLFDWDMAAAAHSAETALRTVRTAAHHKKGGHQKEHLEKVQKGFMNFFKSAEKGIKLSAAGIVDISKLAGNEVAKMMDLQGQGLEPPSSPARRPAKVPQGWDADEQDTIPSEAQPEHRIGRSHQSNAASRTESLEPVMSLGGHTSPDPPRPAPRRYGNDPVSDASSRRKEAAAAKVAPRTASDIRSAYGRDRAASSAQATGDTAAIMGDNVARLKERQERLERLDDRGAELAQNAANFADMAKQLNAAANKPWWKLT